MTSDLLKERDAARITGRSVSTLRQARSVRQGELDVPKHTRIEGRVFYAVGDLVVWMREHGLTIPADLRPPDN